MASLRNTSGGSPRSTSASFTERRKFAASLAPGRTATTWTIDTVFRGATSKSYKRSTLSESGSTVN